MADQPWQRLPAPAKAGHPSFISQKLVAPASSIADHVRSIDSMARRAYSPPALRSAAYLCRDWLSVVSVQSEGRLSFSARAVRATGGTASARMARDCTSSEAGSRAKPPSRTAISKRPSAGFQNRAVIVARSFVAHARHRTAASRSPRTSASAASASRAERNSRLSGAS